MTISKILSPFAASLLVALAACGGSTPKPETTGTTSPPPSQLIGAVKNPVCDEVHEKCEAFEGKGGRGQECHDMSEGAAAKEEDCVKRKDECLKACATPPK